MAGGGVYWDDAAEVAGGVRGARRRAGVHERGGTRGARHASIPTRCSRRAAGRSVTPTSCWCWVRRSTFASGYGRPPTFAEDAKVVMIDVDPVELGRNRPLELGLAGDIDVILRQLTDALPKDRPVAPRRWRRRASPARGRRAREARRAGRDRSGAGLALPLGARDRARGDARHDRRGRRRRRGQLRSEVRAGGPRRAVARPGAARLSRRRSGLRAGGEAPPTGSARPARVRRRRLRAQRHGARDRRALQASVHLHHRQRRRLGPDPEPPDLVLRRVPSRRHVAADDPLRSDGRGARRPRRVRHGPERDRPRARARALASDEVWCINVVLDPEAYRKSGQVSMAI